MFFFGSQLLEAHSIVFSHSKVVSAPIFTLFKVWVKKDEKVSLIVINTDCRLVVGSRPRGTQENGF
jgi:hypothetical protein